MLGVNLVNCTGPNALGLSKWYKGPTLVDLLGKPFRHRICIGVQ